MQSPLLTIETQLTIADLEFLSTHPELHHYTTFAGLEGIVRSNTIWASHFSDLNDATEVILSENRSFAPSRRVLLIL